MRVNITTRQQCIRDLTHVCLSPPPRPSPIKGEGVFHAGRWHMCLPAHLLTEADLSTFVSIGNALQPFTRLLEGVRRIAAHLPQPVVIQHGHTDFQDGTCQPIPFVGMDEFTRYIRDADLLIMHAGAGSVIHAVAAGKIPVIMPRRAVLGEHVNDHQAEFARALAETGKAVVADSPEDLLRACQEAMTRQQHAQEIRAGGSMSPLVSSIERVLSEYAGQ